jgi:hypothetical protein
VWLQVAAELGIFGLAIFLYLVVRAYSANLRVLRMLKLPRRRKLEAAPADPLALTPDDRITLDTNAKGMIAALVGWTVCAFFASVAFNWTFYYVLALAVAGREIVASRRVEAEPATAELKTVPAARLMRVHA